VVENIANVNHNGEIRGNRVLRDISVVLYGGSLEREDESGERDIGVVDIGDRQSGEREYGEIESGERDVLGEEGDDKARLESSDESSSKSPRSKGESYG
jgi:hypothetical protein